MKKKPVVVKGKINGVKMTQIQPEKPTGIDATLAERGAVYGSFVAQACLDQLIKAAFKSGQNWDKLPPYMRTALEMVSVKLSRLLNGDFKHKDTWHDAIGYLRLVEKELEKAQ